MGRIKKNVLKYGKKELNSSVSVFLDLTEPKRNETKLPKYRNLQKQFCFGRPLQYGTRTDTVSVSVYTTYNYILNAQFFLSVDKILGGVVIAI